MTNKLLKFYSVDDEYLNYLNKIDKNVPENKGLHNLRHDKQYTFDKFYIGILFKIKDNLYIAPVSSNKNKYQTSFMIEDDEKNVKGSIRFNYMIPVNENNITKLDFGNFDRKRASFLKMQIKQCNKHNKNIITQAVYEYKKGIYKKYPNFINYCDFEKLEKACNLYNKFKKFNEMYLIDNNLTLNDLDLDIIDNQLIINSHDNELIRIDPDSDISELIDEIKEKQEENKHAIGL